MVKDALASAVEIAIKPKRSRHFDDERGNNIIQFNSRFGGVTYR